MKAGPRRVPPFSFQGAAPRFLPGLPYASRTAKSPCANPTVVFAGQAKATASGSRESRATAPESEAAAKLLATLARSMPFPLAKTAVSFEPPSCMGELDRPMKSGWENPAERGPIKVPSPSSKVDRTRIRTPASRARRADLSWRTLAP